MPRYIYAVVVGMIIEGLIVAPIAYWYGYKSTEKYIKEWKKKHE